MFLFLLNEIIPLQVEEPVVHRNLGGRPYQVCADGTFLILNPTSFFHFSSDGKLIRKLGKKGGGPGEFRAIFTGTWDGKHYVIFDAIGERFSIFDDEGRFLKMFQANHIVSKLGSTGDSTFVLHFPRVRSVRKELLSDTGSLTDLERLEEVPSFHKASPEIKRYLYNNCNHWIRKIGSKYHVFDELSPRVYVYESQQQKTPKVIPLGLPGFVEAPETFFDRRGKTPQQFSKWWFAWSRNVGFHAKADSFLAAYEVPNPDDPHVARLAVSKCGIDGMSIDVQYFDDSYFVGANPLRYYILQDIDDLESLLPKYHIIGVPW